MAEETSVLAILALIFGFIIPPVGIILGIIALNEVKKGKSGKGMAIAGIIIGSLLILISILVLAASAFFIVDMESVQPDRCSFGMQTVTCSDMSKSGNVVMIAMQNDGGDTIRVKSLEEVEGNCNPITYSFCTAPGDCMEELTVTNNAPFMIRMACSSNEPIRSELQLTYTRNGLEFNQEGTITIS